MKLMKTLALLSLTALLYTNANAQAGHDFCDGINVIMKDAPNKFRNVRGKQTTSNMNASIWKSSINIPGVISSRFVMAMGLFYEGALIQTRNKKDLKPIYDRYKSLLAGCLKPQHYSMSLQDNFHPGLEAYKKVVFMADGQDNTPVASLPPHVALEVDYNKDAGTYTVVLFIFNH